MFKSKGCYLVNLTKVKGLSHPVYGRILNYHIGIRTQSSSECLIQFTRADLVAQAGHLIGQKVVWKGKNKMHIGKIAGLHGKNGVVRVKFKKGVPGQALGTTVELIS
jgi:large subunit ribosomal protein L35Ae